MKIGTKSILFGAHCWCIHPFALAAAWTLLYGLPLDPRLWVAFFVHDLGYWGKSAMDDAEGERHPELGSAIMRKLFGDAWGDWTLLHSRFYARKMGSEFSTLCVADKLATLIMPIWLYVPMLHLTGELQEYMQPITAREDADYVSLVEGCEGGIDWVIILRAYMYRWVANNRHKGLTVADLRQEQCRNPR